MCLYNTGRNYNMLGLISASCYKFFLMASHNWLFRWNSTDVSAVSFHLLYWFPSQVCITTSRCTTTEEGMGQRKRVVGLSPTSCGMESQPISMPGEVETMLMELEPAHTRGWVIGKRVHLVYRKLYGRGTALQRIVQTAQGVTNFHLPALSDIFISLLLAYNSKTLSILPKMFLNFYRLLRDTDSWKIQN